MSTVTVTVLLKVEQRDLAKDSKPLLPISVMANSFIPCPSFIYGLYSKTD